MKKAKDIFINSVLKKKKVWIPLLVLIAVSLIFLFKPNSDAKNTVTDVAKYLHITTGSASTNLKSLKLKGLVIEDDNKFLTLSEEGEGLARTIMSRKRVLKQFLTDVLKVSPEQAEIDTCKTEHLISPETTKKLQKFLEGHGAER